MTIAGLDRQLLHRLSKIPEISLSGFTARASLTGTGVTLLKGRSYFGSWRLTGDSLGWMPARPGARATFVDTVDDAVHHTMLTILRNLEMGGTSHILHAKAG